MVVWSIKHQKTVKIHSTFKSPRRCPQMPGFVYAVNCNQAGILKIYHQNGWRFIHSWKLIAAAHNLLFRGYIRVNPSDQFCLFGSRWFWRADRSLIHSSGYRQAKDHFLFVIIPRNHDSTSVRAFFFFYFALHNSRLLSIGQTWASPQNTTTTGQNRKNAWVFIFTVHLSSAFTLNILPSFV